MAYRILFALVVACAASFPALAQPRLHAATLPNARAVELGDTATVYATIMNVGDDATNCRIELDAEAATRATLDWQLWNEIGGPYGNRNEPFDIYSNTLHTLLISITPTQRLNGSPQRLRYLCDNGSAPSITGTNDIFLRAAETGTPTADVIMIMRSLGNDGIIELAENGRRGVAAGALVNIGETADVTLRASMPAGDYFNRLGPLRGLATDLTVCRTDAEARCIEEPSWQIRLDDLGSDPVTFNVYFQDDPSGSIPLLPEFIRLAVIAEQDGATFFESGVSGASSVAVADDGPQPDEIARGRWWGYFGNPGQVLDQTFYAVVASNGDFALVTYPTRLPVDTTDYPEVLFGNVALLQSGAETRPTGQLTRLVDGAVDGTASIDGLRIMPRGAILGPMSPFGSVPARGYFSTMPPDTELEPMHWSQSDPRIPVQYRSTSLLGTQGDGMLERYLLQRDAAVPQRFTGNYWPVLYGSSEDCDVEMTFAPRTGNPAPQSFDTELQLTNCAASVPSDVPGNYTGWTIGESWGPGRGAQNGETVGCRYLVFVENEAGRRQYFSLAAEDPQLLQQVCIPTY